MHKKLEITNINKASIKQKGDISWTKKHYGKNLKHQAVY